MRYPEIEFQPLDVIKKYQEERLVETIKYLNENSPYYKRLFAENHIDISKIKVYYNANGAKLGNRIESRLKLK